MKPDSSAILQYFFERFLIFGVWVAVAMGMITILLLRRGLRRMENNIKNYRGKNTVALTLPHTDMPRWQRGKK